MTGREIESGPPTCRHERRVLRKTWIKDGRRVLVYQCQECGWLDMGHAVCQAGFNLDKIPEADLQLLEKWKRHVADWHAAKRQARLGPCLPFMTQGLDVVDTEQGG
jgi:hypothetical protein